MKHKNIITVLAFIIALFSGLASSMGIFSHDGNGPYKYETIRGKEITIYGVGLYKHMSAEVAPQGIAQDYVTFFVAIPFFLISLFFARKGSIQGRYLLAGSAGYFFVTYMFYMTMGMYNIMFLPYVILCGSSFIALYLILNSFDTANIKKIFNEKTPVKLTGGFLLFNSISITFLWLGIVIPPLLDGSVIPVQVEHYTTLIVQGFDLSLLLPTAFISAVLLIRKQPAGYLFAPVYFVFLSILMSALTAKIFAMSTLGYNVIPAIFIIPFFNLAAILCAFALLNNIKNE